MDFPTEFVNLNLEKVLRLVLQIVDLLHFHDIMKRVMMEHIVLMELHVMQTAIVLMQVRVFLVMEMDVVQSVS